VQCIAYRQQADDGGGDDEDDVVTNILFGVAKFTQLKVEI